MKQTLLAFTAVTLLSFAATSHAQTLTLLGSDDFTIDGGGTTASYTQDATTLTLVSPFALGDTIGGIFGTIYDWSAYSDSSLYTFGLLLSAPGASPNIGFTVEFFNGALDEIVNGYQGGASGLGTTAIFVPLAISAPGSDDFSTIGGLQFTWDSPGTGTVVVEGVAVQAVPEPSTWALIGLAAAMLGGRVIAKRRGSER